MILDLQGTSLVNYPAHVSSVIFMTGCNLHCPYCYNKILVYPERNSRPISLDNVISKLKERQSFITGVCITGGEPTINQSELLEILSGIKEALPSIDIKLDTNGTLPSALDAVFKQGYVNYVAMDYKTAPEDYKGIFCKYDVADAIKESMKLIRSNFDEKHYEFRTTVTKDLFNTDVSRRMAELIESKDSIYFQNFKYVGEESHVNIKIFEDINNTGFSKKGLENVIEPFKEKTNKIFFRNF